MRILDLDMKIVAVRGFSLSSPYHFGPNLGQPKGVKSVGFVELVANDGTVGIGETYAGVYAPELIEKAVEFLAPEVIGTCIGASDLEDKLSKVPFLGRDGLLRSVSSAIEIALWDLRGKVLNVPVWSILGGINEVSAYASGGSAASSAKEVVEDVEQALSKGFNAFKMRVGWQEWSLDLGRVESASNNLSGSGLMVDCIMGTLRPPWTGEIASSRARELEDFGLAWLEEPVFPDDFNGLADVKRATTIPLASGEAFSSRSDFERLAYSAVDIIQFDATHAGGIGACIDLSNLSSSVGKSSAVHVWGSACAIAANASVAAAGSQIIYLEFPLASLELSKHMWIEPPTISSGVMRLPDTPGLGVSLTQETKDRFGFVPGSGYRLS